MGHQTSKPKVKHHTPAERLALRRHKERFGQCKVRRRERRDKDPRVIARREELTQASNPTEAIEMAFEGMDVEFVGQKESD